MIFPSPPFADCCLEGRGEEGMRMTDQPIAQGGLWQLHSDVMSFLVKSAIIKNLNRKLESLHQIERTVFWPLEDCDSRGGEREMLKDVHGWQLTLTRNVTGVTLSPSCNGLPSRQSHRETRARLQRLALMTAET